MPKLAILTGKHQGQKMNLPERELFVGRDQQCEIRLAGTEVSRRHSRIRVVGETIFVSDLGSRNGTLVNDVAITQEIQLRDGDELRIGAMVFRCECEKPKPVQSAVIAADGTVLVPIASEDSIADWLTEDDPKITTGDSTVIGVGASSDTAVKAAPKKLFGSIKEEAADIIRRHFESLSEQSCSEK